MILSSAVQALEACHLVAGRAATEAFHAAFSTVFLYCGLLLASLLMLGSLGPAIWRRDKTGSPLK